MVGMRVVVGSDEAGEVPTVLRALLAERGHEVVDVVPDGTSWTAVGRSVAEAVADGRADRGVVCCWTGTGVSIAANKVPGVRAALCTDAETARGARRWNDANVLALSLRLTTTALAAELLDAFLGTEPDAGELEEIARVERELPSPPWR
jgi:ribose 5-phosphate isomerase B